MKVVVFFATGYEEIEALSVVDVLRRGGVEVIMTGVGSKLVTSARNITVTMDAEASEVNYEEVDMIVLPGGLPGVDNLYASEVVRSTIAAFKRADKWLAAICAAPSILGKCGMLVGERATCYPGFEESLEGAEVVAERVVVSGKTVTGIGAGASLAFALELLKIIAGEEKSEAIKKGMLIN
ncbi:MAG: DJ-1 family glyoxalase III [Cellulosilyticaceae bacterium]